MRSGLKDLAERHGRSDRGKCFFVCFLCSEQLLKLQDYPCYSDIKEQDGCSEADPPVELTIHPVAVN